MDSKLTETDEEEEKNNQSTEKTRGRCFSFMGLCLNVWYRRRRFSEMRGNIRNQCDNKKSEFGKRRHVNTSEDQETSRKYKEEEQYNW